MRWLLAMFALCYTLAFATKKFLHDPASSRHPTAHCAAAPLRCAAAPIAFSVERCDGRHTGTSMRMRRGWR